MLHFAPIYHERVWGGRKICDYLNRQLPEGRIGESWELVDRPGEQSQVSQGPWVGCSLREIIARHSCEVLGPNYPQGRPFPIMVKWLDCEKRLSLQVHPPAAIASALGGEAKTEFWYIVAAESQAALLVGLKPDVTREQFQIALQSKAVEALVPRIPVRVGDSLLVKSGCLHAIDAGNLILEIQQNSDTTYRVYDWDRPGIDGKPRQLHTTRSLQAIDFGASGPVIQHSHDEPYEANLAHCPWFRIRKRELNATNPPLLFCAGEQPRLLHVIWGTLKEDNHNHQLTIGDNVLLCYGNDYSFRSTEGAAVLITENFV